MLEPSKGERDSFGAKEYDINTKKLVKRTDGGYNHEFMMLDSIFTTKEERSVEIAKVFMEQYNSSIASEKHLFDKMTILSFEDEITPNFYEIVTKELPESLI